MADLLDPASIDNALGSLAGWRHEDGKLVKDVTMPTASQAEVERTVMAVADQLNHHPKVERDGDSMRFLVWTHSAGGVTEKDVTLAARIDEVLARAQ